MQSGKEPFEAADLIYRYLKGELSQEEEERLRVWLESDSRNQQLLARMGEEAGLKNDLAFLSSVDKNAAWQAISEKINSREVPVHSLRLLFEKWKYAAAVLLLGAVTYVASHLTYNDKGSNVTTIPAQELMNDALPGGDKATLTLADGTVMSLHDIENGTFKDENGIRVSKVDGQIVYEVLANSGEAAKAYNTIETPIGGQYHIVLEDGSKIWLNSASSLRFPTAFSEEHRKVDLTGEGYFEVAENKNAPFIVQAGKTVVEVLGTHFNVMAYENENVTKTTLLEGSVKVGNGTTSRTILPGQQALVGDKIKVNNVDASEEIAWKNGYFQFENEDLRAILRQLTRWYEVGIENDEQIPDKHFTAVISRNTSLSKVLNMLEISGELKFRIENKKISIKEN